MLKSSVLSAIVTLAGSHEYKLSTYIAVHLATADELDELSKYSNSPRDIASYLGDTPYTGRVVREISSVRALHAITLLDTPDVHNNVGRRCSQPWDRTNREWFVVAYLSTCRYIIFNECTGEYRMVESRTMFDLY